MAGFRSGLLLVPMLWEPEGAGDGGAWPDGRLDSCTEAWPSWELGPTMEGPPRGRVKGMKAELDTHDVDTWEKMGPNMGAELDAVGGAGGRAVGLSRGEEAPFCKLGWSATWLAPS